MEISNNNKSDQRIMYLDFLRVAAMIAVIILHTASVAFNSAEFYSVQWEFANIYDSLVRWAVPVFTMVSGTMFLDNSKRITIEKLYKKYILRIVIAFVFWSVLYYFLYVILGKDQLSIKNGITAVLTGHYHLWFLYMIAGLYFVTPILRKITECRQTTVYFLVAAIVVTFLLQSMMHTIELIGGWAYDTVKQVINGKLLIHLVLGYSPYFVAGYFLHNTQISRKAETIIYVLGALGFISTPLLTHWVSNLMGFGNPHFYKYSYVNVFLESISVFVFAKQRISRIKNKAFHKTVFFAAKLSFGVYLVHVFLLDAFREFVFGPLAFSTALSIPAIVLIVLAGSLAVSYVLNKIPIVNKYLV